MKNYTTYTSGSENVTIVKVYTFSTTPTQVQMDIMADHEGSLDVHDMLPLMDGRGVLFVNADTLEDFTIELSIPKPIKKVEYGKESG